MAQGGISTSLSSTSETKFFLVGQGILFLVRRGCQSSYDRLTKFCVTAKTHIMLKKKDI